MPHRFLSVTTVWSNLVMRAKVSENGALVHGGTSGIGIARIQILKLFKCQVFTTVGNEKKGFCKNLVKNAYNYNPIFRNKKIKPNGINLILDFMWRVCK